MSDSKRTLTTPPSVDPKILPTVIEAIRDKASDEMDGETSYVEFQKNPELMRGLESIADWLEKPPELPQTPAFLFKAWMTPTGGIMSDHRREKSLDSVKERYNRSVYVISDDNVGPSPQDLSEDTRLIVDKARASLCNCFEKPDHLPDCPMHFIEQALAEKQVNGWRSDAFPKDGREFLAYDPSLVDNDDNQDGVVIAFWDGRGDEGGVVVGSVWNNDVHAWEAYLVDPKLWREKPSPPVSP